MTPKHRRRCHLGAARLVSSCLPRILPVVVVAGSREGGFHIHGFVVCGHGAGFPIYGGCGSVEICGENQVRQLVWVG